MGNLLSVYVLQAFAMHGNIALLSLPPFLLVSLLVPVSFSVVIGSMEYSELFNERE